MGAGGASLGGVAEGQAGDVAFEGHKEGDMGLRMFNSGKRALEARKRVSGPWWLGAVAELAEEREEMRMEAYEAMRAYEELLDGGFDPELHDEVFDDLPMFDRQTVWPRESKRPEVLSEEQMVEVVAAEITEASKWLDDGYKFEHRWEYRWLEWNKWCRDGLYCCDCMVD